MVLAQIFTNVTTIIFITVVYLHALLFRDYIWTLVWSFVLSQALHSSKAKISRYIAILSRAEDTRPLLFILWDLISQPWKEMKSEGKSLHVKIWSVIFGTALDWCIELFALVGLMSLTSRLLSVWILVWTSVSSLLFVGILYIFDRRIFAYSNFISDDVLASVMVISSFSASICFIVLFLGMESVLEGINAGQDIYSWAQPILDGVPGETGWSKHMPNLMELARETAIGLESRYNSTFWYPLARDTVAYYIEHGNLSIQAAATHELWDETGFSGVVGNLQEHAAGMNVSMDHLVNYGRLSGKIFTTGINSLAGVGASLVMLGFKVVLFFTCAIYVTSKDNFLEQSVGVLLPIPPKDQQVAVEMLRNSLRGVFFLPCKVACLHGAITLLSFTVLRIQFPFFAAFTAVVISILPIVPAYVVCWPWAITLALQGQWIGITLAVSQYLLFSIFDTELCTQGVREANPYMTGLSSFLGFAVFGSQGVLLGPLIICSGTLLYKSVLFFGNSSEKQELWQAYRLFNVGRVQDDRSVRVEKRRLTSVVSKHLRGMAREHEPVRQSRYLVLREKVAICALLGALSRSQAGVTRAKGALQDLCLESCTRQGQLGNRLSRKETRKMQSKSSGKPSLISGSDDGQDVSSLLGESSNKTFDPHNTIRVKLRRKVSDSSTSEMGLEERASEHVVPTSLKAGSGALHTDETWRLDIAPTLPWEEFLLEVQDVMSLTKVSGVYGKDGSRIQRVQFIDDGEVLDVATEVEKL